MPVPSALLCHKNHNDFWPASRRRTGGATIRR